MQSLEQQLSNYASYHRDRRNVATHLVGIPLIVLAVATLLSRPALHGADWTLAPALPVVAVVTVYYLLLDRPFGLLMGVLLGAALAFGAWAAAQATATWLALGVGGFVVGWVFQFVGHAWEGRKPAFADDVMGLIIGPLFVAAELVFALGLRAGLRRDVEAGAAELRARCAGR